MKVEILRTTHNMCELNGLPYGIELVAETDEESEIIKRFWNGGVKTNHLEPYQKIGLTFKDLVKKFEEELTNGTCKWCGEISHLELEKMTTQELFKEMKRLVKQTTEETIGEFGDQQGNIRKLGCIQNELGIREKRGRKD